VDFARGAQEKSVRLFRACMSKIGSLLELLLTTDECRQTQPVALIIQASRSSGLFRCPCAARRGSFLI
jgi:hypothetical protein